MSGYRRGEHKGTVVQRQGIRVTANMGYESGRVKRQVPASASLFAPGATCYPDSCARLAPAQEIIMSIDPYASCPCGSGKKFKWCCQPITAGIQHAWQQEHNGQHDAALKIMNAVVQQNPTNPEAWGQKAYMLYAMGKNEAADQALEKA